MGDGSILAFLGAVARQQHALDSHAAAEGTTVPTGAAGRCHAQVLAWELAPKIGALRQIVGGSRGRWANAAADVMRRKVRRGAGVE